MNASVLEGTNPAGLLNDVISNARTYHIIGDGAIIVQLGRPYLINSIKYG